MQFTDYQNIPNSEKITLAILSASKRVMGWSVHSGAVYKVENFNYAVIESIEDSGTAYTEVEEVGEVVASTYFLDRETATLYLRTTDSDNPNGRFLAVTVNLHFANVPITLSHDLGDGFEVYWEPLVKSTSEFGVEIDTVNQTSEALEGSGSLTLQNDFDTWPARYDKMVFENQRCYLYAFHRELELSEAKLIFKGKVEKKGYTRDVVTFQLKDQFAELRSPVPLANISDLGERTGDDLAEAKQRMIFGRVYGNRPTNIDQVLDGYPLTGTVSALIDSNEVEGTGTLFLSELSPDDKLVLLGIEYNVATITSNTELTLTEEIEGTSIIDDSVVFIPARPKRFINRRFKVAGHSLRKPETETLEDSSIDLLKVASTRDIYPGDHIYVGPLGSGEIVTVNAVYGDHHILLATSLAVAPASGVEILRPSVQNVRIDSTKLIFNRDYSVDAVNAEIELTEDAEANVGAVYQLGTSASFSNLSRTVTGTGFKNTIEPGYMIGIVGNAEFFEVLSVTSDTSLLLRVPATFTASGLCRYKSLIYDPDNMVLSLDVIGRTENGLTSGILIKTAPSISKALVIDAGLVDELNVDSFTEAEQIAYQEIGIVIPETFDETSLPTFRDVLNKVNKSVFGVLVQNADFEFSYHVLRPRKSVASAKFSEMDMLTYSLTSTAENVVKTVIVEYGEREYDPSIRKPAIYSQQKSSDASTYLVKTDRTKTIKTYLVHERDADIMAKRWAFILRNSAGRLTFTTKLQAVRLEIGNIIEVEHRKLFDRFGSTTKLRLLMVEYVGRSGSGVKVEATDLSNTFNRVAAINTLVDSYSDSTDEQRLYGGFYTDQYGLIDNDENSFETNLIW